MKYLQSLICFTFFCDIKYKIIMKLVKKIIFVEIMYLLPILKFLAVKAVEQQGKEEVEHHEVTHNESRKEDEEATLSPTGLFSSHAVPQRFDPLATQDPEYHHERVEEVVEIPPLVGKNNLGSKNVT